MALFLNIIKKIVNKRYRTIYFCVIHLWAWVAKCKQIFYKRQIDKIWSNYRPPEKTFPIFFFAVEKQ